MRCGPERKRTETAASVSFSKQFFRGGDGAAASGGGRRGRAPRPLLPCRRYGGVQIAADVSRRRRRQGRARFPPSLPPSLPLSSPSVRSPPAPVRSGRCVEHCRVPLRRRDARRRAVGQRKPPQTSCSLWLRPRPRLLMRAMQ